MKKLVLSIIFLFCMVICSAQIAPPKQTDTLIITSVKYNYADIDRNNWPCKVIYKSTRDIHIGQQTFNVIKAYKNVRTEVVFSVYDAEDNGKKEYELLFYDKEDGTFVLTFSGYEFRCHKKENIVNEDADVVDGPVSKSYNLEGCVNGTLAKPVSNIQARGKVVVDIWVDNYGNVQKAVAGAEGTTVTDKTLWQAARKAALGAHFNMSRDAPPLQQGTITYVFPM